MTESELNTSGALEPISVDGVRAVTIGTAIWAVALVICLIERKIFSDLAHSMFWTQGVRICSAGVVLGLLGQIYTRRRVNRLKLVSDIIND